MYTREGLNCMAEGARRMPWLAYRKTLLYWLPLHESRRGNDYSYMYAFALPFFALGAWRAAAKRQAGLLLMLVPVLACFATVVLTIGQPRYRFPSEPAMLVLAAAGAAALARRYPRARVAAAAAVWFIINAGAAVALSDNSFGL
jgi:hypothetical protein